MPPRPYRARASVEQRARFDASVPARTSRTALAIDRDQAVAHNPRPLSELSQTREERPRALRVALY
jgi:hypothetical protein